MGSIRNVICLFSLAVVSVTSLTDDEYYGPQTFQQNLFRPAAYPIAAAARQWDGARVQGDWQQEQQGSGASVWEQNADQSANQWEQGPSRGQWEQSQAQAPQWAVDNPDKKVRIVQHRQSLSPDGNFRYEYAADNGLAAGETIAPDGSRVGAYQYKDPSGQIVTLKYRAGKDGFQILEGNHLPKAPEPLPVPQQEAPKPQWSGWPNQQQSWNSKWNQAKSDGRAQWNAQAQTEGQAQGLGPKQGWGSASQESDERQGQPQQPQQQWNYQQPQQGLDKPEAGEDGDNGEYREDRDGLQGPLVGSWDGSRAQRDEEFRNQGPHSFGEGYAFDFKG